jgi:hypothetical protein
MARHPIKRIRRTDRKLIREAAGDAHKQRPLRPVLGDQLGRTSRRDDWAEAAEFDTSTASPGGLDRRLDEPAFPLGGHEDERLWHADKSEVARMVVPPS